MKHSVVLMLSIMAIIVLSCGCILYYHFEITNKKDNQNSFKKIETTNNQEEQVQEIEEEVKEEVKEDIKTFKISAAGDCTLGYDDKFGYTNSFNHYLAKNNNNYSYFFSGVKKVLETDDVTLINLEGPLTNATEKKEKAFTFKGPTDYVNILTSGSVEMVNLANNHSYDYLDEGFAETKKTLDEAGVKHFGYHNYLIQEINDIKVGFFGFLDIYGERYSEVNNAIKYLKKENCDLIIASMHWGIEKDYIQSKEQIKMGHYLIDNGVDLVIGTHPHVIQGIEKYNNKYIVYSLANFSFGGNKNPADKDTFIFQQTFTFKDGKLQLDDNINIIPASVTSTRNTNDYKPKILDGDEKDRVFEKIKENSSGFEI